MFNAPRVLPTSLDCVVLTYTKLLMHGVRHMQRFRRRVYGQAGHGDDSDGCDDGDSDFDAAGEGVLSDDEACMRCVYTAAPSCPHGFHICTSHLLPHKNWQIFSFV
jgi:hypothetical protein